MTVKAMKEALDKLDDNSQVKIQIAGGYPVNVVAVINVNFNSVLLKPAIPLEIDE